MSEPLNSDPEIQHDIDQTIAEMRRVEANYLANLEHLESRPPGTIEDEMARSLVVRHLRDEWLQVRRPYVERVQMLVSSSRRNGVTYIEPLSQELAGRIGQVVAPHVDTSGHTDSSAVKG